LPETTIPPELIGHTPLYSEERSLVHESDTLVELVVELEIGAVYEATNEKTCRSL
jgi:hypothetical protein